LLLCSSNTKWNTNTINDIMFNLLYYINRGKTDSARLECSLPFSKGYDSRRVVDFDKLRAIGDNLGHARAVVRVKRIVEATAEQHGEQPGFSYHGNKKIYAWELYDVRPLANPFPVKGKLGIYEVETPKHQWEKVGGTNDVKKYKCRRCGIKGNVVFSSSNPHGDDYRDRGICCGEDLK